MRSALAAVSIAALALSVWGCADDLVSIDGPPAPSGLTYLVEASGDPDAPLGVVLHWNSVSDPDLDGYQVYSRAGASGDWFLRGTTTSNSFHDNGIPHLQYYVTAIDIDGVESEPSDYVEIDEHLRLQTPASITGISLDRAIHLQWADNAFSTAPGGFAHYRVYGTSYNIDTNVCGATWSLEGTTVAPSFLVGALANGVPRCFAVSAISIEGFESLWSPLWQDTPRPDGHNVIVYTAAADAAHSGFRFFLDGNNDGLASPIELGLVGASTNPLMDFTVTSSAGKLYLTPLRTNTDVRVYGTTPINALTDIDLAPTTGYARPGLEAKPLWGYVFRMDEQVPPPNNFYQYGAVRVSAVGVDYVIFDWSYQTDPGNPELIRVR